MKRSLACALVLIALTVLVLIFNKGEVKVNLVFGTVELLKPVALFAFTAVGVVIGVLLK